MHSNSWGAQVSGEGQRWGAEEEKEGRLEVQRGRGGRQTGREAGVGGKEGAEKGSIKRKRDCPEAPKDQSRRGERQWGEDGGKRVRER